MGIKQHIAFTPLETTQAKATEKKATGNDWSMVAVRLKGTSLLLASIYLTDGIGYAGENIAKLNDIMVEIKLFTLPFVIQGDWNMTPTELRETPLV